MASCLKRCRRYRRKKCFDESDGLILICSISLKEQTIILKTFLIFVLRTCKTMSRKTGINREDKSKISQLTYTVIFLTRTTKLLAVVTSSSIYHYFPTWKMFWEEEFIPVTLRSFGKWNVQKHKEIKNGEQYNDLDIYLELGCLDKQEVTYKGPRDYVGR